ncbi:unnamed protein product [Vicia faba]|uniref:RING-type E3 ubiquitin transferase n=1 Tax=Vicia faba TaxID=3906 RepID=A0AAV1BAR8_VICFA|nr:unnamed protein product [Vicia faba]
MASSTLTPLIFYIFIILHLQASKAKQTICNTLSCGDIDITFPFGLKQSTNQIQNPYCSYYPNPSFQLSCNKQTQTILNLPKTDNLIINNIDYKVQTIKVNDPKGCLPKRYLENNFNLSGSPFKLNPQIYSSDEEEHDSDMLVFVSWGEPIEDTTLSETCEVISRGLVPLRWMDLTMWPFWVDLNHDVELVWNKPGCEKCALNGQVCGFSMSDDKINGLQVECFPNPSNRGLSTSAKYSISIGLGLPGLLCLVIIFCFIRGKMRRISPHNQRSSNHPSSTISLEPLPSFVTGLDGATIEKYPKILIGESGRLLKPSDNTCSICLSEYEPKETLRSIPECNHYFHAACIDEWLKMNGTCPICRNSPEAYSSTTPFFSSLLLSPNSSPLTSSR